VGRISSTEEANGPARNDSQEAQPFECEVEGQFEEIADYGNRKNP